MHAREHEAFFHNVVDIAAASEAAIIEQLVALCEAGSREKLAGALESVPTRKLALILLENDRHRFMPCGLVDRLLACMPLPTLVALSSALGDRSAARAAILGGPVVRDRVRAVLASLCTGTPSPDLEQLLLPSAAGLLALAYPADCPVAEQQRLATLLSRLIERGQIRALVSILSRICLPHGTVELLGDLHLRWLWRGHASLLLKLVESNPSLGLHLARRLLGIAQRDAGLDLGSISPLLSRLPNARIWDMVCHFVQLHDPTERGRALSTILEQLDAARTAQILAERYDDGEINVYWLLFPEAVRRELCRIGRGRVQGPEAGFGHAHRSSTRDSARTGRARWRKSRRQGRHGPDAARALSLMVDRFGFEESMSYREAQQRYWKLVMKWHPDRTGADPASERLIRDLNHAWDTAKVCFARSA
jgi:hypothetical protein